MLSLSWLLQALQLRTSVHRYAMQVLAELGHPPLADPATRVGPRTVVAGLDPIRILVCGGGLAVGYGVTSRQQAFDGPLAQSLAEDLARGVTIENRAVQHVDVLDVPDSLGAAGTHTFHVLIWCPSFAEGLKHFNLRRWRNDLHSMVRSLRSEQQIPILLTHMPVPAGLHPAAVLARPWVARLNTVIEQVARSYDGVIGCPTEPFTPSTVGHPVTDAVYFQAVASCLVPRITMLVQAQPRSRRSRALRGTTDY